MSDIYTRVLKQPWKIGHGQPLNILDPTWGGDGAVECGGEIEWEGRWWECTECGYCGCWQNTTHHTIDTPTEFLKKSITFFFERRSEQGMEQDEALQQAMYLAAVALRNAATMSPEKLGTYLQEHVIVR